MIVGLDVGGTKTEAVAVDENSRVIGRVRLPTEWGAEGVIRTVLAAVDALAGQGVDIRALSSVGIGMPGQIEPGSTHVLHAVNLGIADIDLAAAIGPRLGVRVGVENDVKAAALGAYALRGRTDESMAYLNLGTGIAAGIVHDGRLWRGARGTAGEVGHISVDPAGPLCRCGQRGCIEVLAGGASIADRWGYPAALPVVDVLDAAERGDPAAIGIRAGLMSGVAAAVRILILTVDVDVVVLGGGLTALGDRLMNGVRAELVAGARESAFLTSLRLGSRIQLVPTGSAVAAFGAALIGAARQNEQDTREAVVHG